MSEKEILALSERDGMGRDAAESGERSAGEADELMFDGKNCFGDHVEIAFEEEVVNADDGASEGVFDGGEERVGCPFGNGGESGIERGARNGEDFVAKELNG